MKIYISYKYTNVKDKESLRRDLEKLATYFEENGHKTFLLGRDVQKWEKHAISTWKNASSIIKNLLKSSLVFALVESDVQSTGLSFELFLARLFRRKIIFGVKEDIDTKGLGKSSKIIKFNKLEELKDLKFN
jgi:hypothetical protein